FRSPKRHHSRPPPGAKPEVKETLDARLEHIDGESYVINQYIVKEQVGRGSYGAVCRAVHSVTGETFAIKEFSKSRLRKHSLSAMLRQRHPGPSRSPGFPPLRMREFPPQKSSLPPSSHQSGNPLDLIRHEIAALKKLNHENVVSLIEVLDNPAGDSLYMVLEWCSRGVVMNVSETATAQPYEEEQCRLYFRDLILGIEYLHSQGIVHRDIKPDNLLLNEDNVLKIVDFGVSEFFAREQENGDTVTKQAGSPAFMAPEMCVVPRIEYSGRASDIWAMGVTLYCLVFGRLPFVGTDGNLLDLYRKTQTEDFYLPENTNADLRDLFARLLDKNFRTRIRMPELREHPWITLRDEDPLLSYEENTASAVTDVTEQDLERAIKGVRGVFDVVRAVNRRSKGVGRRTQS
ncbi:kinase-like domain-containing protein, partial [Myxozyma melibiosi]